MKFLREFGMGIIYILALPFFLVMVALVGFVMLIDFLISLVVGIIRFFKGDSFFKVLKEDEMVKRIKEEEIKAKTGELKPEPQPEQQPAPQQGPVYVQQNYYQQPMPPYGAPMPNPGYGYPPQPPYPNQPPYPQQQPYPPQYGAPQYIEQAPAAQIPEQKEEPAQIAINNEEGGEQ